MDYSIMLYYAHSRSVYKKSIKFHNHILFVSLNKEWWIKKFHFIFKFYQSEI